MKKPLFKIKGNTYFYIALFLLCVSSIGLVYVAIVLPIGYALDLQEYCKQNNYDGYKNRDNCNRCYNEIPLVDKIGYELEYSGCVGVLT
jgi:hypothetical protein